MFGKKLLQNSQFLGHFVRRGKLGVTLHNDRLDRSILQHIANQFQQVVLDASGVTIVPTLAFLRVADRVQLDDVASCEIKDDWVIAASTVDNCNFILRALLDRDIQILELHEDKPDLEDMFIHHTAGKVT